jgi:malate/lactate dehydrogenase
MSVPSVLGKEGVRKILELKLAPDEQEGLKKTVEVLTPAMKYVEELLHLC